jgi:hypothetical protein
VRFISVITQLPVTIATNYQALTCFMNVSYVVGHERTSSPLLQYIYRQSFESNDDCATNCLKLVRCPTLLKSLRFEN